MAAAPAGPDSDFWFGRAFSRAWAITKTAPLAVLGTAFLFGALPEAIWDHLQPRVLAAPEGDLGMELLVLMPALVLSVIWGLIAQGVTAIISTEGVEGRRIGLGEAFAFGFRLLPASVVLGLINAAAFFAGIALLIVPAAMVSVLWVVSGSALAVERIGPVASLKRSSALTKGARWQVFALLFLFITIDLAYSFGFDRLAGLAGAAEAVVDGSAPPSMLYSFVEMLWNWPSNVAGAAVSAGLYVELRRWKEGADTDKFAEIFS